MDKHDVIFIGSTCCDLIFSGLPALPKLGEEIWAKQLELTVGGMMNSAAAAARLGLNVGLAIESGEDLWGDMILAKMKEENIDLRFVQRHAEPYPQLTVALNYKDDRSFVSYADQRKFDLHLSYLNEVLRTSDSSVYHFSAQKQYSDAIVTAKSLGKRISLDTSWDEEWLQSPELKALISLADIFIPNLKEAQLITGKEQPEEVLDELSGLCPVIVIKLGEQGAVCRVNGKQYMAEGNAVQVVDSTGAGDCFAAGFLYGWLHHLPVEEALRIANYCGSKCVQSMGGYTGAPTLEQLLHDFTQG